MPRCLVLGDARQGSAWRLRLEDLGECWQCEAVQDAEDARAACDGRRAELVLVCAGEEGARFLGMMQARPPMSPPWLVTEEACPFADGRCSLTSAESLHGWWRAQEDAGRLPVLALGRYGQMVCLARGLMTTLNVPRRLRAWEFLPDMLALGAVHPALMEDLRGRLYPLVARRHALTAATVERRLRLAIESTWNDASLSALERFFGHSVDPERGKPTNREFLFRVQERLLLAGQRIA